MPTAKEIEQTQGTRLQEAAPWETYAAEMDEKLPQDLADAVAAYAEKRYHEDQTSSQNKEKLHEERERSAEVAKQYEWVTKDEYADYDARVGRTMTHAEFITKLRELKVNCWYTQHPHDQKAVLIVTQGQLPPEVACWVQIGVMPELSMFRFDDHDIALDERRRGWRTCLLQLILKGIVTEDDANKKFGKPRTDAAFHRYNATLKAYRDAGGSLSAQ